MKTEKKINILSRVFRFFAVVQMLEILAGGIARWVQSPSLPALPEITMIFINPTVAKGIPPLSEMSFSLKAVGTLAYFTPIIAKAMIFAFLAVLFTEYKRGRIFSEKVLRSARNIGYVILIGTLLSVMYAFVAYYLLPADFPLTHRQSQAALIYGPIGYSLRFIIVGLFFVFISWVTTIGKQLEDEQKYTV